MSETDTKEQSDYFGSWVLHTFNSEKKILEKTESIGCVERKLSTGKIKQDFRFFRNGKGQSRILMMTEGTREDNRRNYPTWVTNVVFFKKFCNGMLEFNEITKEEHDNMLSNLDRKSK